MRHTYPLHKQIRDKELASNRGQANRYLRIADELERDIKTMRELQQKCVYNDMEAGHLEAQIQIFSDTMNKYRDDAVLLRRMR